MLLDMDNEKPPSVVKYHPVIMRCPVSLANRKYPGPNTQWYHAKCGGKMLIGNNAMFKCELCGFESHVKNWRYGSAQHQMQVKKNENDGHEANSLSIAGQICTHYGKQWLMEFLANMGEDW